MQSRKKVPRFKREAPEKRRADLVQAAIRCLAEGGMAAFKMELIAAEGIALLVKLQKQVLAEKAGG